MSTNTSERTVMTIARAVQLAASIVEKSRHASPVWRSLQIGRVVAAQSPDGTRIEIQTDDQAPGRVVEAKLATVAAKAGAAVLHALPSTVDLDQFPSTIMGDARYGWTVQAGRFLEILQQVVPARAEAETRHAITGILITQHNGSVVAAATDGRRLHIGRISTGELELARDANRILVEPDALVRCVRAMGIGEIVVEVQDRFAVFTGGPVRLVLPLLDVRFPDYAACIPRKSAAEKTATFDRARMLAAVESCRPFCHYGETGIRMLTLRHEAIGITILAEGPAGHRDELVAAQVDGRFCVNLNPDYLRDALRALSSDRISMRLAGDSTPVRLDGHDDGDAVAVIMPIAGRVTR